MFELLQYAWQSQPPVRLLDPIDVPDQRRVQFGIQRSRGRRVGFSRTYRFHLAPARLVKNSFCKPCPGHCWRPAKKKHARFGIFRRFNECLRDFQQRDSDITRCGRTTILIRYDGYFTVLCSQPDHRLHKIPAKLLNIQLVLTMTLLAFAFITARSPVRFERP